MSENEREESKEINEKKKDDERIITQWIHVKKKSYNNYIEWDWDDMKRIIYI